MREFPRGRLPLRREDGLERGRQFGVVLDGRPVTAFAGETVAALLVVDSGLWARRTTGGAARGIYCGMGVCFDCLVVVDGVPNTRACMTLVADGMRIEHQDGPGFSG
jgi:D-hydroxyproline dehydrogenase subunit gamma